MKGAEFVANMLKYNGIEFVSTLCGNGLHLLYPELVKEGIRLIDVRHEQAAAYIVDSYARLTGKLGVCIVSSGVAHAMALSGLVNSHFDCAPVLLITGASSGYGSGKGVFQEMDQEGLASKICKYSNVVNSIDELAYKLGRAISFAVSGTPGPVHLTIPENVLREEMTNTYFKKIVLDGCPHLGQIRDRTVSEIVGLLDKATKPLLIVGGSLFYCGIDPAKEVIEFSKTFSIPMVVPIWDRGIVDEPFDGFIGVIGAASGGPKVLDEADLIILVGTRVDYRIGFLTPPNIKEDVKIIRIDVDPEQMFKGIRPDIPVVADPTLVFRRVREEALRHGVHAKNEWLIEARKRFISFREKIEKAPDKVDGKLTGKGLVKAIKSAIEDSIFLIDGGNIGQWVHMLADKYPRSWLTCGASGVVGWGLSGAIGAKLAFPKKRVLLLSGDGAFGFNIGELDTAIKHYTPFVAIVAVDEAWGIVVSSQKRLVGEDGIIASKLPHLRYDKIAEAFGAKGFLVEDEKDLKNIIFESFDSNMPTVIQVPISWGGPRDLAKIG
ncbi:MAG: thiamine pyrophosphate-binding protein [Nitrososphaeria archaeon]|nr:thiamine pyrophosphate-binding protein [Nitrososphaeria archaeon]